MRVISGIYARLLILHKGDKLVAKSRNYAIINVFFNANTAAVQQLMPVTAYNSFDRSVPLW